MAQSKYSALGLPKYLFQEQSKTSPQISPDATFNPANAIGGGGGFVSQTAPNQQPRKKEIYLDYKSIFRLWKPENVALVIAKLKKEGFEVAFIQKLENGKIFTSKIDDSKFKDKDGNLQNIFGLSDDFIKDNFSQQTHEKSAEKLKLASDDSIILNYDQLKEIHSILTQEHWADKKKIDTQGHLTWGFLGGSTKKSDKLYADVINSANYANISYISLIQNLLGHEDFNITDPATIKAFNLGLEGLTGIEDPNHGFFQYNFFSRLDEKKLGDLFDATPSLTNFSEAKKILLKKELLKQLWFKQHSDFKKDVMDRVRTLDEFKDKSAYEIAASFFGDMLSYEFGYALVKNYSLDISEIYPEAKSLEVFNRLSIFNALSVVAKHQKKEIAFGQKFEFTFTAGDYNDSEFIKYKVLLLPQREEEIEDSLTIFTFIKLFSDSEINQHFGLTEKFGDALIAYLEKQPTYKTFESYESYYYPKIAEQLNENQRKRFLDDLLEKASSLDIDNIIEKIGEHSHPFMQVFSVAQNNLDKPGMKKLAETMLIKLTKYLEKEIDENKDFNREPRSLKKAFAEKKLVFTNLTPEFQDFLIEMDEDKKIKLNEIRFHAEEEIYAKFDKNPFEGLNCDSGMDVMPRDIYLKNYKEIIYSGSKVLSWDKSKVSSQKIPTSPLQINLFDLKSETLKKIKDEIDKGDLDAKNILSLKIFGIEREKTEKTEEKVKLLLEKLVGLFTNLKHVRVDIGGIEASAFESLERLSKEKGIFFEKYNSSDLKKIIAQELKPKPELKPEPQEQFEATKQGDKIFISNNENISNKAIQTKTKNTFLMEKAGEIISRPQELSTTALRIRSSLLDMNPAFSKLEDDLLVEIDKPSSSIDLDCKKNKGGFEEQKKGLSKTNSPDQTICSFTRNLEKNKKTTLPSISSNNQIIGYYTEPPEANVTFFKDEKSGFYCAKSSENCQIHYIIQGHELKLRTPTDNLDDLPDNVKKILNQYGVGDNSKPFPFAISYNEYKLPDFQYKEQFLSALFDIENKGSCRHRVAALAHRFTQEGLQYGADFKILEIDQNHVALEVKKVNKKWIAFDLGGATANLIKKEGNLGITSQGGTRNLIEKEGNLRIASQGGTANLIEKEGNLGIASPSNKKYQCFSALPNLPSLASCRNAIVAPFASLYSVRKKTSSPTPKEKESTPHPSKSLSPNNLSTQASLGFNPQNRTPSPDPSSPQILSKTALLIEEKLKDLNQLTKIDTLNEFKKQLEESLKTKNSSLFLKTDQGEELKNYLLKMGNSLQDSGASVFPAKSSEKSFETFYVSTPKALTVKELTLEISKDNSQDLSQDAQIAKITDTTPLFSFLKKAEIESGKQHVLIIDWGKFNASSQVAFNTMFDKNDRKIDDHEIPDNVTIVCIDSSNKKTTDSSILSRFNKSFDLSSIGKNQYTNSLSANSSQDKKIIGIDCEGFVNWQEKLFGRVVLNGDKMEWQKSDFVKNLEQQNDQPLQLNFKNFSSEQQKEMKIFFEQGKSSGSINYHGYEIKVPSDLIIQFEKKEFEFTEVLKSFKSPRIQDSPASSQSPLTLKIYQDLQASKDLPKDIHLINSFLFDKLLAQPKIEDNLYQEELGLIQESKKPDSKTLKLFLSENLSNQQFYCLLNQAKQHQVSLELYLAKDIKMPDKGFDKFTQEQSKQEIAIPAQTSDSGIIISSNPAPQKLREAPTSQPDHAGGALRKLPKLLPKKELQPTSRIIITNDIEKSLKEFKKNQSPEKALNLVNIEDVLYGDLFEKNQHRLVPNADGTQYFSFKKIKSDIKTKLDAKEIVVLKGQFSDELLSILHPQILDIQQKFSNLHFIIEDKNISEAKQSSTKLSWLDQSLYKVKPFPKNAEQTKTAEQARDEKIKAGKLVKEKFDCVEEEIPKNSFQKAQEFIAKRKEALQDLLEKNSVLQIFGHSGVGKSSLFRELKKDGFAIYDELSSFESWANNKEQGKPKILVIDEFNVDGSTNFTTFRDLANNLDSSQRIFHQGKFYDLDKNHKVVFLGNPKSYGNRFEQKLFEDCKVAELHLKDFPVSYIYENILKEPIFKGLSGKAKNSLTESNFKEIAIEKIKEYKATNQFKPQPEDDDLPKETVRELQEKVLKEIAKKIQKIPLGNVENDNFIATQANKESIEQLQSAIQIRQLQKSAEFPPQFLGTCGVIFEGDSGVGKSVMIEAVLENRGITKTTSLENLGTEKHYYYKIPASLPMEEIKKNLTKAFELGVIVVFDEMNTRIKEGGLEKDINALLTGQHPTSSEIKPEAGFMIIASVNQATNAGRSKFSSAIEHRCNIISAKPLSEYQKEDFEKIITNWAEHDKSLSHMKQDESKIKEIAISFKSNLDQNPRACNLRDLKKILENQETLQKILGSNSQEIAGHE